MVYPSWKVISLCSKFIQINHLLFLRILKIKHLNISTLMLLDGTIALIAAVAASDSSLWIEDGQQSHGIGRLKEKNSDDLISALTTLLYELSSSLFPGHHDISSKDPRGRDRMRRRDDTWWSSVQPYTPQEIVLAETNAIKPLLVNLVGSYHATANWSVFDNMRLDIGLRLMTSTAMILRLHGSTTTSSIDFQIILQAFCSSISLLSLLESETERIDKFDTTTSLDERTNRNDHSYNSLSDSVIEKELRATTEHLICVIHYIISTYRLLNKIFLVHI